MLPECKTQLQLCGTFKTVFIYQTQPVATTSTRELCTSSHNHGCQLNKDMRFLSKETFLQVMLGGSTCVISSNQGVSEDVGLNPIVITTVWCVWGGVWGCGGVECVGGGLCWALGFITDNQLRKMIQEPPGLNFCI